jgi:hypothetical protein
MEAMICGNGGLDRDRRLVPVRNVVRSVLSDVLHTSDYDPTGPDRDRSDESSPAEEVARLRRYWGQYGKLPLPERMMATLTDPRARPSARYQAARVLTYELTPHSSWSLRGDRRPGLTRPAPTADQFERPTVAEAVLVAMDQARTELVPKRGERWFANYATRYVDCLGDLGDPRIAPELARRAAAATTPAGRLALADAACRLGLGGPLAALCREVATGTVRLPAPEDGDRPTDNLRDLLLGLVQGGLPGADDALFAGADPAHPYFRLLAAGILIDPHFRDRQTEWNMHPVCLAVLRVGLADRRPTGGHSYRRGTDVEDCEATRARQVWTPPGGADPGHWHEHVEHRAADDAMGRLADLVAGLPDFHPLRHDADRVIAAARDQLTRFARSYRLMTWDEQRRFSRYRRMFIPDIRPLGRPATPADVTAGRAVFSLPGAKPADGPVPGWLVLKADARNPEPPPGRIVQAEVGPDGAIAYGVIFRHEIRAVRADEVERVEPLEPR